MYEPSRKGGAKSSIKIFSDDEEETLVSFCNIALEGTFGVSKEFVHELMWACARECDITTTFEGFDKVSKLLRLSRVTSSP